MTVAIAKLDGNIWGKAALILYLFGNFESIDTVHSGIQNNYITFGSCFILGVCQYIRAHLLYLCALIFNFADFKNIIPHTYVNSVVTSKNVLSRKSSF